ncbi:PQQ-binding-like beta-propeller repeat protein [Kolteria novifilia]|uniref:outer membrane protein assembly factor BamB family protein n=1 Tax=Kolteria novifilia TaxID=2527975 RepID=UPI003AF3C7F1
MPSVFLDVSIEARNRLGMVEAYVEQGQWSEAVALLQSLVELYGDKVVPMTDDSTIYHNVRLVAHRMVSGFPAEGLAAYRSRVDSQAEGILRRAKGEAEETLLRQIVGNFYCSGVADEAIERLGDLALAEGSVQEAFDWWEMLLPEELAGDAAPGARTGQRLRYPDPDNDQPRLLAKWALAKLVVGDVDGADRGIALLKRDDADKEGRLAGRDGRFVEVVLEVKRTALDWKQSAAPDDWPTFAGDFRRSKVAPKPVAAGDVEWEWILGDVEDAAAPDAALGRRSDEELKLHPVIVGDEVIVATGTALWSLKLSDGRAEKWYDFGTIGGGRLPDRLRHARHTLTVSGDKLFVRTGEDSGRAVLGRSRIRSSRSKLYCFDYKTQRMLWHVSTDEPEIQDAVFEGAPVVAHGMAFVALTRQDAMAETSVAAFDLATGERRWRSLVCEASLEDLRPSIPRRNLLTYAGGNIYYATNMGAVASLDARSGRLKWVSTYERSESTAGSLALPVEPDLNPAVFDRGRLFVAAHDSNKVHCFDAYTGQVLWEAYPPVRHLLGVVDDRLMMTGKRVWGIDVATGKVSWYWPENLATGYGRGVLAGGFLYWPTTREIHVIDPATGIKARPSIALGDQFGIKGGNLAVGHDYLIIAQANRVYALAPHSRVIDKLQLLLTERPSSARLHLKLAEAAFADKQYGLAAEHFQLAANHAEPDRYLNGQPLRQLAKHRLHDTKLRQAEVLAKEGSLAEAETLLLASIDAVAKPDAEQEAHWQLAQMWLDADKPDRAIPVLESLAVTTEHEATMADEEGVWRPLSLRAARRLAQLHEEEGEDLFASKTKAIEAMLSGKAVATSLVDELRAYPDSKRRCEMLLRAGPLLGSAEGGRLARWAYKSVVRSPYRSGEQASEAMVGLKRLHERLGYEPSRDRLVDLLARRSTVGDQETADPGVLSASSLPEPSSRRGYPAISLLANASGGSMIWPEGVAPSAELEYLLLYDGKVLEARLPRDDEPIWKLPMESAPSHVVRTPSGLLIVDGSRLRCVDAAKGEIIWERPLDGTSTTWLSAAPISDATGASSVGELPRFGLDADTLVMAGRDGTVRAFDTDDGHLLWERRSSTESPSVDLVALGDVVCFASGRHVDAWGLRDGRQRFKTTWSPEETRRLRDSCLRVGDQLVIVTKRSRINAFDEKTGEQRWSKELVWPSFESPRLFGEGAQLFALVDGYQLNSIDPTTGETLWSQAVADRQRTHDGSPFSWTRDRFVFLGEDEVSCWRTADGVLKWRYALPKLGTTRYVWCMGATTTLFGTVEGETVAISLSGEGRPTRLIRLGSVGEYLDALAGTGWLVLGGEKGRYLLRQPPSQSMASTGTANE